MKVLKEYFNHRLFLIICSVLFIFCLSNNYTVKAIDSSNENLIFNEADKLVKKYNVQGSSIALIENGKIKEIKNYGYANLKENTVVTNDTEFKIASISKTVTAYGIMKLVDEGKLDLDVPISKYLTKWNLPDSEFDENKVTLRTLMSHTSGITDSTELGYGNSLPKIEDALKERNIKLKREPGTEFEYSSFAGFGICQLIIEEVTGMKFEDYMKEEVFNEFHMENSNYDESFELPNIMATPYAGINKPIKTEPIVMVGAGGLNTTSTDLSNFVIGLINFYDNGNLEMFTEQKNTESKYGVYGLGIIPCQLDNGKTIMEHNGTLTGWNAQIAFEPESKDGIVILTNSDKAFYFTYDLLGKWSNAVVGGTILDSEFVYKVENIVRIVIGVLTLIIIVLAFTNIKQLISGKFVLSTSKNQIFKSCLKSLPILLVLILWYIIFYTQLPFKLFFSMPNYYIFTFITPNFHIVSILTLGIGIMLILKMFLTKNKTQNIKVN